MAGNGKQTDSSCFPSYSSNPSWNHDVFLSFRGEDTRKNFTDHLYTALDRAGVHTFMDDHEIPRGKEILPELLKAIQESRISIVVFSKNYASSRWCLEELRKIIECKTKMGQVVMPIFYHIDPSHVRKQRGSYGKAFARHESYVAEMEKVKGWRAALSEAANLSGWDLQNVADGRESKFIKKIVEEVQLVVNHEYLSVAVHPVGIHSRVEEVKSLLSFGSGGVRIIGIYGMGGIGKTTIAKALYNIVFHLFESSCFISNVQKVSEQVNGVARLQEILLSEILRKKKFKIWDVDRGTSLIKHKLRSKTVLLVLDDLNELSLLYSLAGQHDWFGSGSRIMVTTRNEHLLRGPNVDESYEATVLNNIESMELFCWHAFRKTFPLKEYMKLSIDIVRYAEGLPLALEVLGSHLFGRTVVEWKSAFQKLRRIPHSQIQQTLRISFDQLDVNEKEIFLDISCFFIGMDKDYVINILNGCGLFAEIGISVLVSKCLLKIGKNNELQMHDLIMDMGREIIHEESLHEPEKRSRLWVREDVLDVLKQQKGTDVLKGVFLEQTTTAQVNLSTKTFERMNNLRLLKINNVNLTGNFKDLFKELRWLSWHHCNLERLPSDFRPQKLAILDMRYNVINSLWYMKGRCERGMEIQIHLSRGGIPDWFSHKRMGSTIRFDMPLQWKKRFVGMIFWAAYAANNDKVTKYHVPKLRIRNRTNDTTLTEWYEGITINSGEHSFVSSIPLDCNFKCNVKDGDNIEVCIEEDIDVKVEYGIHLVFKPDIDEINGGQSCILNENVDGIDDLMSTTHSKRRYDDVHLVESTELSENDSKKLRLEHGA